MQELDNLLLPMIDNDDLKNHISWVGVALSRDNHFRSPEIQILHFRKASIFSADLDFLDGLR